MNGNRDDRDVAFYRFIYKKNNGFVIQYKNTHYGFYERIEDALYDRDRLEYVDWDIQTWTELPESPNPYYHMKLPEFNHDKSYIHYIPSQYRVARKINGKTRYFGTYRTYEEAKERRDSLILNNWRD